ncbi:MAG: hypothetical protein ACI92I_000061 [Acidimicrobiales bacterium]|jgi:hypothetical protein
MTTLFTKTVLLAIVIFVLFGADSVLAGFGVTPPFVRNTSLTRNSTYEQQILLVRGDPTTPLKASITVDAPAISDWIEIIQGETFTLPRGEQKVPMTVRVTVPDDADFKTYTGAIRIKTGATDDAVATGAVNISLGAQIDIELHVIDKVIKDFRLRKVGVNDLNEGTKVGWLYFPGKINFAMLLENTGNVDVSPSEIVFKIYDTSGTVLLEETTNKGKLTKIEPFGTEEIVAEVPTRLPTGSYLARYEIMNDEDVKYQGELNLNILPYGTLQTAGFGFTGLSSAHKLSVLLPILSLLVLMLLLAHTYRERRRRTRA